VTEEIFTRSNRTARDLVRIRDAFALKLNHSTTGARRNHFPQVRLKAASTATVSCNSKSVHNASKYKLLGAMARSVGSCRSSPAGAAAATSNQTEARSFIEDNATSETAGGRRC
jgi:hypothetical protein